MLPAAAVTDAVRRADEAAFLRGIAEGRRQAEADDAARLAALDAEARAPLHRGGGSFRRGRRPGGAAGGDACFGHGEEARRRSRRRQPLAEIEALARNVFAICARRRMPWSASMPSSSTAVKPRLDQIAREAGFTGTIVVLGEPDMVPATPGSNGPMAASARDSGALEAVLDEVVRRYLGTARQETRS